MKLISLILLSILSAGLVGCDSSSGDVQPEFIQYVPEPTPDTIAPESINIDSITINQPLPHDVSVPTLPTYSPTVIQKEIYQREAVKQVEIPELPSHKPYTSTVDKNKVYKRVTVTRKDSEEIIPFQPMALKPQIDILFVMDDSMSMAPHQANLSRNIDKFIRAFSKNNQLDYQIAVTSIYDSKRYYKKSYLPDDDERNLQGVTEMSRLTPEKRNFYRLGQLVPIPGSVDNATMVTSDTKNAVRQLKKLLKVGTKKFFKKDTYNEDNTTLTGEAYGPRYEEVLYPMMAALDVKSLVFGNNATFFREQYPKSEGWDPASNDWSGFSRAFNKGFPRPGAHLAIIFVTDTFDQSYRLSAHQVASHLSALKSDSNFDKISTYGVLHPNSLSQRAKKRFPRRFNRKCRADEDVRGIDGVDQPQLLESFLSITRGNRTEGSNIFNICNSNYGTRLAQVGTELRVKTLRKLEIPLSYIPEQNRISIKYAGSPVYDYASNKRRSKPKAYYWKYRSSDKTIVIYNLDKFNTRNETNNIEIDFTVIDPNTATTENSRRIGN